ncbi:demethylmenaquinone methyltransferase [bacterium BMS3Bbin10]|nr:demethylmenaquinone methyltransferase [bacterium BMS3Bbin10]
MQEAELGAGNPAIDLFDVQRAYRRWAPIYDMTVGKLIEAGHRHTVEIINRRKGTVLEVGVGTGLSLPHYARHLQVTGIDISPDMLRKARTRVDEQNLGHISALHEMDAGRLEFPDEEFDTVVAMYMITTVPNPEQVLRELERVCAPGGEVILVNHFSVEKGPRARLERLFAPLASTIGWRPVFPLKRVLGSSGLRLTDRRSLRPWGLFTMLRFVKQPDLAADHKLKTEAVGGHTHLKPARA